MSGISSLFNRERIIVLLSFLYFTAAIPSAWNIVTHTQSSTKTIEEILSTYNLKNEGEQAFDQYTHEHPILGMLFGSAVKNELKLPSQGESADALHSDVSHLIKTVRQESNIVAWWSWSLLSLSLFYAILMIALERSLTARSVIFSLVIISCTFFFIGIFAPAMVIWTAPSIPLETGKLNFVLQHEVRGIAAILWELITTGHWIIGGLLMLFSIVTPLTKIALTIFVTLSNSKPLNYKIGEFLHAIGKWSMADVFVAGVLLALYALKAQEATKSIPCLGLYYFIGYCLLSMTTTELLVHSGMVSEKDSTRRLELKVIAGLFVGLFCFISVSSLYTYQQYSANIKEKIKSAPTPQGLDNSNLVLPAHK